MFRGGVTAAVFGIDFSHDTADDHNLPFSLQQMGQHRFGQRNGADQVSLQDFEVIFERGIYGQAALANPGIVDQEINVSKKGNGLFGQCRECFILPQIQRQNCGGDFLSRQGGLYTL